MNSHLVTMTHPRRYSAHWRKPLTAPEAAQACPTCLPSSANQLTFDDDPRLGRSLRKSARFAPRLSTISDFTEHRPAAFPPRILAMNALIGNCLAGSPGLRPLAPRPSASDPNQRKVSEAPGFACPFLPSSPSPKPRLRAKRIGSVTFLDLSIGVFGNEFRDSSKHPSDRADSGTLVVVFPVPNDQQEMHFSPEKCRGGSRSLIFPAVSCAGQARSGGNFLSQNPTKTTQKPHGT